MKNLILLFFSFLLLVGCNRAADPKPARLLDQPQMVDLMVDIHVAEALVENKGFFDRDTTRAAFKKLEAQIFEKHGVPDSVFRQSYEYYLAHLKELDQIYEAVIDTLSLRELRARGQEAREATMVMERENRRARARAGEQVYKSRPFTLEGEIYKHIDFDEKHVPYVY